MSKALETIVVRRGLPAEGKRKVSIGKMPTATPKGEVDKAFTLAQTVIDRFGYSGDAELSEEEWESMLDSLQSIHTNTFNSGGLKGKAGWLRRELIRQKRRYGVDYSNTNKPTVKGGKAKSKAKKAAKAAASRALRSQMKSPKRG